MNDQSDNNINEHFISMADVEKLVCEFEKLVLVGSRDEFKLKFK